MPNQLKAPKSSKHQPPPEKVGRIRNVEHLKIVRAIIWFFIGFLLFRGTVQILRPDQTNQLEASIIQQTAQLQDYIDTKANVGEFAKAFLKDYLTYKLSDSPEAYSKKITAYGSSLAVQVTRFGGDATTDFLQVVRCTPYSSNQWDAVIRADVTYTKYEKRQITRVEGGTTEELMPVSNSQTLYYIVPVYVDGSSMAIEALPVPTAIAPAAKQQKIMPQGAVVDNTETAQVKAVLSDFFTTYFSEGQTKINYYLAPGADPAEFYGLAGASSFVRIGELTVYRSGEIYTAVAHIVTQDWLGTQQTAQLHLKLVKTDKYYIESIRSRTDNLL